MTIREVVYGSSQDMELNAEALRLAARPAAADHETDLVAYLESGDLFIGFMGPNGRDLLDPSERPIVPRGYKTDGTWAWDAGLAYYVKTYHVSLSEEFVSHVASLGYKIPKLSEEQLDQLTADYLPPKLRS